MIRFTVELHDDLFNTLADLALRERRSTREQAAWMLEAHLRKLPRSEPEATGFVIYDIEEIQTPTPAPTQNALPAPDR